MVNLQTQIVIMELIKLLSVKQYLGIAMVNNQLHLEMEHAEAIVMDGKITLEVLLEFVVITEPKLILILLEVSAGRILVCSIVDMIEVLLHHGNRFKMYLKLFLVNL